MRRFHRSTRLLVAALAVVAGMLLGATRRRPRRGTGGSSGTPPPTPGPTRTRPRVTVAGASSPAVASGLVFAGLDHGIGAWRLSDGLRRWTYGSVAYGDPAVSGGRLYVAAVTSDGDQPVVLLDQFALGAAAPGVVS